MRNSVVVFGMLFAFAGLTLSAASPAGKTLTISVEKNPVFQLTLSKEWSSKPWRYKTILIPPAKYPHIQLWNLKKGLSLRKSESEIAELVKSEVLNFKVLKAEDVKLAGISGRLLTGKGLEADDQDPSNAKVFLFPVNGRIFLLCIHGEGDEAAKMKDAVKKILDTIEVFGKK